MHDLKHTQDVAAQKILVTIIKISPHYDVLIPVLFRKI
jgi:hypothetical protein